jgi:hypothetical protein
MFTQSLYLLTTRPIPVEELERYLRKFPLLGMMPGSPNSHWAVSNEAWVLAYAENERGRILVDSVSERYPDRFDQDGHKALFSAWSMGSLGPAIYPGALERGGTQAWVWKKAGDAVRGHAGFLRLRMAYDPDPESEGLPEREPVDELLALSRIAYALLEMDGVRCYFNPNGEAVRSAKLVWEAMDLHKAEDVVPLGIWTNVRLGKIDPEATWTLMDSVGMGQLGYPDVEIAFPSHTHTFEAVDEFIRDLLDHMIENGDVFNDGHRVNGPGDLEWGMMRLDAALQAPPRTVLRITPPGVELPDKVKGKRKTDA